jgi:hypothetical protein
VRDDVDFVLTGDLFPDCVGAELDARDRAGDLAAAFDDEICGVPARWLALV